MLIISAHAVKNIIVRYLGLNRTIKIIKQVIEWSAVQWKGQTTLTFFSTTHPSDDLLGNIWDFPTYVFSLIEKKLTSGLLIKMQNTLIFNAFRVCASFVLKPLITVNAWCQITGFYFSYHTPCAEIATCISTAIWNCSQNWTAVLKHNLELA